MSREYPAYPVPSASALVCHNGNVLLIKRKFAPGAGKWSLPGGKIELGEGAAQAAAREVLEETGVEVRIEGLLDVVDAIFYDDQGRVRYHYLIIVYRGVFIAGESRLCDEAMEVRWVPLDEAASYDLTGTTRQALATFQGRA